MTTGSLSRIKTAKVSFLNLVPKEPAYQTYSNPVERKALLDASSVIIPAV